jgi:hypothetical protein
LGQIVPALKPTKPDFNIITISCITPNYNNYIVLAYPILVIDSRFGEGFTGESKTQGPEITGSWLAKFSPTWPVVTGPVELSVNLIIAPLRAARRIAAGCYQGR